MSDMAAASKRIDLGWLIVAPVVALAWLAASLTMPAGGATGVPQARSGAWLTELAVWALQALTAFASMETLLSVFSAAILGVLAAYLFRRLLYNGWPLTEAAVFLGALAASALVVHAVASDQTAIPIAVAVAAVIPGLRRLEAVGDAQAEMSFGLVLPLLFLAGPSTSLLAVPLALTGALLDPLARKDSRAFVAMFLVALMPTLLVVVGIAAFTGWDAIRAVIAIYGEFLTPHLMSWDVVIRHGLAFALTAAPFTVVLISYYLSGDDRRRQPLSAALVWILPAYLLVGCLFFAWPLGPDVPPLAFLFAFAAWLAVARIHAGLRRIAVAVTVFAAIASWAL